VSDPVTGTRMSLEAAIDAGVIDGESTVVKVPGSRETVSLKEAIDRGMVDGESGKIVDVESGKALSFADGEKKGLLRTVKPDDDLHKMSLDEALSNRETIKSKLKAGIIDDVSDWGVTVKSVEIQDISPSASMQDSMERQAAAERERRAIETTAEGNKNAAILEADGKLEAAKREAKAQVALAEASANAITQISSAIVDRELPAMFLLGDRYITSLEKISQSQNSKFVIYPADLQQAIKGMLGGVFKP